MTRYLRLAGATILIVVLLGALQINWHGRSASADSAGLTFDSLTPAPYSTVAPGPVLIGAHANGDAALTTVTLSLDGSQIEQIGSQTDTFLAISQQRVLSAGTHTATVVATDADGTTFQAQWDFIVSSNASEGEWFTAAGQPKADQINATMRSLVEAFRWHLYGLSWDGSPHPDLPTHVGFQGTGAPLTPWVNGTTFDQANTQATLRSLVEAFRWHFWGISWDGADHPDVPTHASTVLPPQSIDPWFTAAGQPIPDNITATLRSLVESFRWHFWGYSWDGNQHPDIPTHASFNDGGTPTPTTTPTQTQTPTSTATPTVTPPSEGSSIFSSKLDKLDGLSTWGDGTGALTTEGYKLKLLPGQEGGATVNSFNVGDASYSVNVRKLDDVGDSAGCLLLRAPQSNHTGDLYAFCLLFTNDEVVDASAFLATRASDGSIVLSEDIFDYTFDLFGSGLDALRPHTIKVVAEGDQLWFYVDDGYLGTVTSDGPTSGTVGFWAYNVDDVVEQSFEFSYLSVHGLAP